MRNFHLLKHLSLLTLLFSTFSIHAQGIFLEHNNNLPDGLKVESDFDGKKYTNVFNENDNKLYIYNPSDLPGTSNSTAVENLNNINLTVNFIFDPDTSPPPYFVMVYDQSGYFQNIFFPDPDTVTFNLPPGTYDIMVDFAQIGATSHIVIKELVEVSGNAEVQILAEEADNYISAAVYDEAGGLLEPGIHNPEDDTYSSVYFDRMIRLTDTNISAYYQYNSASPFEGTPNWNFYINDISNRYVIMHTFMGLMFGEDNYFTKMETLHGASTSLNLTNDPDKWAFHKEKIQPSILGETEGINPAYSSMMTYENKVLVSKNYAFFGIPTDPEDGFRAFLDNPMSQDPTNFFIFPGFVDHIGLADPWWVEEGFSIKGNPVFTDDEGNINYASGNMDFSYYFLGNSYYNNDGTGFTVLPFNSKFSFSAADSPDVVVGDNTPIISTLVTVLPDQINLFNSQYRGRYGELRESDFFATQIEAKYNGNTLFNGNYINFLPEFGLLSAGLPADGEIELNLVNSNVVVDGLIGKNISKITYNAGQMDMPPTLQALQFRNVSGAVTSTFESVSEATVRIAAGDFGLEYNDEGVLYYPYNEGNNIEFYYSQYNQNTWTELELTKYPEYFFLPFFGDYYEASLSSVIVSENNMWFDVKIICTDTAGNKQEQIVSPAFKIGQATMGIDEVTKSNFTVYPNPFVNELNINLPEIIQGTYSFNIYDSAGKTVYHKNQSERSFSWNGSSLPKGIYIISIESNGKVIAQKVIKK